MTELTEEDVLKLMRAEVTRVGGVRQFARRLGLTAQHIREILRGATKLPHRGAILEYLGLEGRMIYRRKR